MTPVLCCGAECGILGATAGQHFFSAGAIAASVNTTTKRHGLRAFTCDTAGGAATCYIQANMAASVRHVGRVAIWFDTLPTADLPLIRWGVGAIGPRVSFKSSDSSLYAAVGTTFGASGVAVTTGRWYVVDFYFEVVVAGNDTADVRVNGTACGQAAAGGDTGTATAICLGQFTALQDVSVTFDDIVISHTAADYPIPDGHGAAFVPVADGTHNIAGTGDFRRTVTTTDILNATTDAYLLVEEIPLESGAGVDWISLFAPPNATDYVECVFGPAPGFVRPKVAPQAVNVILGEHDATTNPNNKECRLMDNGTAGIVYTKTGAAGVTAIRYHHAQFAVAPTGGAWTVNTAGNGDFNALRVRFGSPAAVDANPDAYFDGVVIEADFPMEPPLKYLNLNQSVKRAAFF